MIHRTIFNSREKLERFLRCLREWPGKEDELAHYGHRSMDRRWRYLALRYKEQFKRNFPYELIECQSCVRCGYTRMGDPWPGNKCPNCRELDTEMWSYRLVSTQMTAIPGRRTWESYRRDEPEIRRLIDRRRGASDDEIARALVRRPFSKAGSEVPDEIVHMDSMTGDSRHAQQGSAAYSDYNKFEVKTKRVIGFRVTYYDHPAADGVRGTISIIRYWNGKTYELPLPPAGAIICTEKDTPITKYTALWATLMPEHPIDITGEYCAARAYNYLRKKIGYVLCNNRTIHTGRIHKKLSGVAAEMFAITG